MAQQVKDLALSLQELGSHYAGNFHMPWMKPPPQKKWPRKISRKKRKEKRKRERGETEGGS